MFGKKFCVLELVLSYSLNETLYLQARKGLPTEEDGCSSDNDK
jgi:hypothetical protein